MAHLAAEAARCGAGEGAARRGVACVRVALADLLNLARTGRLLLSAWSSWEEALPISRLCLPYISPISPRCGPCGRRSSPTWPHLTLTLTLTLTPTPTPTLTLTLTRTLTQTPTLTQPQP